MHHQHTYDDFSDQDKDGKKACRSPAFRLYKRLMTGIFLLAFGALAYLGQNGLLQIDHLWQYAPLILVFFGVGKMIFATGPSRFARGVFMAFIGLWVTASLTHFGGLTFANSWPMVVIAVGVNMLVKTIARHNANKE